MPRMFQPARIPGGTVPDTVSGAYTTGQTFKKGAVLIYVAAGTLSEAGADPSADIAGVAGQDAASGPGYDEGHSPASVTGRVQEVSFARANRQTVFSGRAKSAAGGDPTTPTQTLINEQYGLSKEADGTWVVDLDETTTKSVEIVDIDADAKIVFFKFLEAVLATP